jgi:hypothetical protein
VTDLDEVRALLEPPPPPPTEEELDEIYDETADDPAEEPEAELVAAAEVEPSGFDNIERSAQLLAAVLQSSELVPSIELKAEAVKLVISGWSIGTVVLAVQEEEVGVLRSIFEEILEVEDAEERRSLAAHISRVVVVSIMAVMLYLDVGSIQLQAALERVLDDEDFMSETAHALFATMLYAMLGLPRWPERVSRLHRERGGHPIVQELIRDWTLHQYQTKKLRRRDESAVEDLLAELLTPQRAPASSVADRATLRSQILEEIRRGRLEERFARRELPEDLDDDDMDESSLSDESQPD